MNNMKLIFVFILVAATYTYTPINNRSWINFRQVKDPTYVTSPVNLEPDILHAKYIEIEERISTLATKVQQSLRDYQKHLQKYTADVTERVKRATKAVNKYAFVKKPELRHQYGMLFNHHGQVISGLKNMDLFLTIDLPKVEDIAHVPPPFPECDNWAAPHRTNQNAHVYYSAL